jgi:hypothetical protein
MCDRQQALVYFNAGLVIAWIEAQSIVRDSS